MAYFEDLTPYDYSYDRGKPGNNALNIGWLSDRYPFSQGETSLAFRERLFAYCLDENIVNIYRGFHPCEICKIASQEWFEKRVSECPNNAYWAAIGDGEIRVIGELAIYAAPALIYHYVVDHQYRPPDAFIDAVLHGPPPGSDVHQELLKMMSEYEKTAWRK
jgi:hypothetical protein